jgi:hypothetical protein
LFPASNDERIKNIKRDKSKKTEGKKNPLCKVESFNMFFAGKYLLNRSIYECHMWNSPREIIYSSKNLFFQDIFLFYHSTQITSIKNYLLRPARPVRRIWI